MIAGPGAVGGRAGGFVVPLVVVGNLKPRVECDDIPDIQLHALGLEAFDDTVQLVAILRLDVRPEDGFGGLAEEAPIPFLFVHYLGGDRAESVVDFGGQQVPVLEAYFGRPAFQVDLNPAIALAGAEGFFEAGIGLRFAGNQREPQHQEQTGGNNGCASRLAIINESRMDETTQARKLTAHVKAAG